MSFRQETLDAFLSALAARTPAPGGGASCALAGATGAALGSMCMAFTAGNENYKAVDVQARELWTYFEALRGLFLDLADRDAAAYQSLVDARKLPKATVPEKAARKARIAQAREDATRVPEEILARAAEGLERTERLAPICNPNLIADAAVSAALFDAAARGAFTQVAANLAGSSERESLERRERAQARRDACASARARIEALVLAALPPSG